ncbi:glutamine--tRNA ligase [Chromatiales bacterium (ex Bugula neritina AB1)]|nr:glutamine--tRNA ligase [Chromatiales bacterium (ex Bugula neritina AB1)]
MTESDSAPAHFIRSMIEKDVAANKHNKLVATRFPPEPNGYLHLGHAKSICLNFGIAEEFNGWTNLRFDDTNPDKESEEYMSAIKRDVAWLGFKWKSLCYASDYFDQLYDYARLLVEKGLAYVDSLSADEIREYRGSLTTPGKESPYRNRSPEQSLELLEGMKNGDFNEGEHVLRLKIDMASSNINLRDPAIYRIKKTHHYRTADKWNIYPLYDYTHCLSDAIEGITHSLCTLEFEDHRPLYNWVLEQTQPEGSPEQTEFGPLNLEYTILSKRKLVQLVNSGKVRGWDDPRMPTIAGLRRRGYTPGSIREFCRRIGVTKNDAVIDMLVLENCIRDELNETAERRMAVLEPLKVVITSWPEGTSESLNVANHPQNEALGSRKVQFSRELYIEQSDFAEIPPPKFKRLTPGGEVRLRSGYVIRCDEVVKDENGEIIELRCSHDADTLGQKPQGRKVKGVIHWVNADDSVVAEIRVYDRLFNRPDPLAEEDYMDALNPNSLISFIDARIDRTLARAETGSVYQFERQGYFVVDPDTSPDQAVFNRVVALRDTWAG